MGGGLGGDGEVEEAKKQQEKGEERRGATVRSGHVVGRKCRRGKERGEARQG